MWEEAADCLPGMQQDLETVQEQSWCLRQQAEAFQATQAEHASTLIKLSALQAFVKVKIARNPSCATPKRHRRMTRFSIVLPACNAARL